MSAVPRLPLRRLLSAVKTGTTPPSEQLGWLSDGAIPWYSPGDIEDSLRLADPARTLKAEALSEGWVPRFPAGSTVLVGIGANVGRVAFLNHHASGNQQLTCLVPSPRIVPRFLAWQMFAIQDELRATAPSATLPILNNEFVRSLLVTVPPISRQRAIAYYLDRETARIDTLIAAKRHMVDLLEERRKALRDYALDSKPGWRLKRLLVGSMAYGVLVPRFVEAGLGVPMIRIYNVTAKGRVDHGDIAEIPVGLALEYQRTSLREDNVIISVVGSMGRAAVVSSDEHGFNLNRALARLQLRTQVPPWLIWHWTQTTYFMDMARLATGGGTAQPTLNLGDLANFTVGLPLEVDRWPRILEKLQDSCGRLDQSEDELHQQVKLLQERRQALITAAVTGQLDIPEAL